MKCNKNCYSNWAKLLDKINDSLPLFIKLFLFISIILYLLNIFIPFISLIFANIPYYTIFFVNIWRLITTSFITTNILSIIFSIYFWCQEAIKLEREIGTVKYMLIFFMNSFFIQLIYTILSLLFSIIMRSTTLLKIKMKKSGVRNDGLWPILLCDLTLLCLSNPEEPQKFYFFSFTLKAKYYPLFLFAFFTIISGFRIDLEILCGIGFGFLFHFHLKKKLLLSNDFVNIIENSPLCKWMKNLKGFTCIREETIRNNLENLGNISNIRNYTVNEIIEITQNKIKDFKGKVLDAGKEEDKTVNYNNNNNDN